MQERLPVGFLFKQINTVYEKDINNQLKGIGITSSQCEVLDYLFHCDKEEVNQRDSEKALNLKNPTVTGLLQRLDEKGYVLIVPNAKDKRKKNVYLTEKAYDIQRRMEADRRGYPDPDAAGRPADDKGHKADQTARAAGRGRSFTGQRESMGTAGTAAQTHQGDGEPHLSAHDGGPAADAEGHHGQHPAHDPDGK